MNLRPHRKQAHDINLAPLIDMVFLLLTFFIVTTTFKDDSRIRIDLPQATAKPIAQPPRAIEVTIDAQGHYYVDGRALVNTQLQSVKQAMRNAAGGGKTPPVIIDADARTPHQAVVTVMDAAQQLGFLRLSFATRYSKEAHQ